MALRRERSPWLPAEGRPVWESLLCAHSGDGKSLRCGWRDVSQPKGPTARPPPVVRWGLAPLCVTWGRGCGTQGDTSLHSRWELTSYHGAHQMPRMAGTSLVSNGNYTGSTLPATAAGLCVPPCTHLPAFKCPKSHYPRRKPDCIQHCL